MNKRILSAVAVLAVLYASHGQAQGPFYKGKTITILAGTGAGNVYDIFARLFARHLGKHIPVPELMDKYKTDDMVGLPSQMNLLQSYLRRLI